MSRSKQVLINYRTGSASNMPSTGDVRFGEIVVRHNAKVPQLLIKVSSGTSNTESYGEWFVPFIASGDISTAITASVEDKAGVINQSITNLGNKIDAVSATVTDNYALSAVTHEEIEAAKLDAEIASSGYTNEKIRSLSGAVVEAIDGVTGGDLSKLKQKVQELETFSGKVETDYATKEFVGVASGYAYNTAKSEVIGQDGDASNADTIYGAKKYADEQVKSLSGNVISYVDGKVTNINSSVDDLQSDIEALSGVVETLSGDMKTYIDNELSTVYTYKSSVADMEALEAIVDPEVGDVYNVVAANGQPGDAGYTPAGTNYAWNGSEWDALGGVVDLSNYATVSAATNLQNQLTTVNSDISDLKAFTANTAATHDEVATQSAATFNSAYTAAVASAESYTDTKVSDAVTALKGTASESGDTLGELEAAIGALNEKVGTDTNSLALRISELESSASTWNDTAEKALRSAELAAVEEGATHVSGGSGSGATADSNAKMSYTEGGNITLDLSGLIIDCGDF